MLEAEGERRVKRKIIVAILYAGAGLATANWLDIALWPEQPYYRNSFEHAQMRIAVAGSAVFGLACLMSLFRLRHAALLGLVASGLCWVYFSFYAIALASGAAALSNFVDCLMRNPSDPQILALLLLCIGTVYSVVETVNWRHSRQK